jgi:hypothetical protein
MLDPESEQIRNVYVQFGLAVYLTQCVERSLSMLLVTKYGPGVGQTTRGQFDKSLGSLHKKTFGALVQEFKKQVQDPPAFASDLDLALEKRNWLAHRYFWERAGHLMSEQGRGTMLLELEGAVEMLNALDEKIKSVALDWWDEAGLDYAVVEREAAKLVDDARSGT